MTTPEGPAHGTPPEQPAWGQQPAGGWGDPSRTGAAAAGDDERPAGPDPRADQQTWGSPPQQPGVWGGAPGSAWGAPPASSTRSVEPGRSGPQAGQQQWGQGEWVAGQPAPGQAAPGQPAPGQWDQGQRELGQGEPAYGQPGPVWDGPGGAPAWAQQPPPGGGWGPPGQVAGGWGGQPVPGGWGGPQAPWPGRQDPQGWDPHGYPPLPPDGAGRPPSRTPLVVGAGVVALVAVFALLAFVAPGFLRSTVFDQVALQAGVQRVLIESYRIPAVGEVVCGDPAQGPIAVRTGAEFTCTALIDGSPVPVQARITSNSGDFEVVRPDV